jgi:polyhydroxyalkanoate synthesis regulator phasin
MAEVQKQDRLVRESFVTTILERLRDWLPFTKNNTTVNFITPGEETKNAISIYANGEIHIITDLQNNTVESLQSRLSTIGLTVCKNETEFSQLISKQNIGKFVYLEEGSETYKAGLYGFIKNLSDRGECFPYYIGIDIKEDLKQYYTKEECNAYIDNYISSLKIPTDETIEQVVIEQIKEIIKIEENGDISVNLGNYALKEEFEKLEKRVGLLEDWKDEEPISLAQIEDITQIDLNGDGEIM